MTKRRFKFGLAFLGALGIFLMALFALMFLPSLASADKGAGYQQDGDSQSGSHNPTHFGSGKDSEPVNNPGQSGRNPPRGDAGSCAGHLCDAWNASGEGTSAPGGDGGREDGSSGQPNSGSANNPGGSEGGQGGGWGPFAGGWVPGAGGSGGGGSGDPSNSCSGKNCGKVSGDDNNPGDKGSHDPDGDGPHQIQIAKGDNDPSDGNGPPTGDNNPPLGPKDFPFNTPPFGDGPGDGANPPNDTLTDPPTDVPEPLTLSLFAVGLGGAGMLRRRSGTSRAG
jgi:hypothetical protein